MLLILRWNASKAGHWARITAELSVLTPLRESMRNSMGRFAAAVEMIAACQMPKFWARSMAGLR